MVSRSASTWAPGALRAVWAVEQIWDPRAGTTVADRVGHPDPSDENAGVTGNPPYSISPYSAVKRYSGKGDTTLHDAPPVRCGQPAVSAAGPSGGITW